MSFLFSILLFWLIKKSSLTELTFSLPDNEKQCFKEVVTVGTKLYLEFQVVSGGSNDVDVQLFSPSGEVLYSVERKKYDQWSREAPETGIYEFCFSNEFSTFSHKLVYFDFQAGDEEAGRIPTDHAVGPLTLIETFVNRIHFELDKIIDSQTHQRLREAEDRMFVESVSERIQFWSFGQFLLIIIAGVCQVMLLKSFFWERRR